MDNKQMLIGMAAPSAKKRVESYQNISKLSAEAAKALNWSGCMSSAETKKAFINLKNDLSSQNEEEVYEAAGACVHLLANQSILLQVDTSCQKALCDILMKILKTHKKNNLTTRILQSLAKSRFSKEVYLTNLKENFDTLGGLLRTVDIPVAVILETLQVMLVFFNASPLTSVELAESWFPTVFSELFHTHVKVRKVAVIVINHIGEALNKLPNDSARGRLVNTVLGDLKKKYCSKDMMNLLYNKQYDVFRVWRTVVTLFDTQLHASRTLINNLLEVMDKAFKCTLSEVKVEAFLCWRTLIDNFALSRDAISNPRKLHLLISPFKLKNVKTEDVFNMKLLTWWHLVCVMSDKNCLVPNFDLVVVPLLHFCFISGPILESSKGGISNRNLIMSGALSPPGRSFSSLHCTSAEILVQLLATENNSSKITLSVQAIGEHVISSALFLRHYPLLMKCFGEAIQTLNFSDTQQKTLGIFLFRSLLTRIKAVAAPDVQKKEAVDVVRELFSTLSHIESHCEPESSNCHFLFEFYNILTIGSLALPNKIFNSHQYRIASSGGGGARDVMCGTLSNHLVTQLCSPALLQNALTNQRFFTLWETVLENSQPVTGKLRFLEDTIQEMSASALPFLCPEHPAVMCRLWGTVLNQTVAHIEETKTVEADEGEPDWSCIYSVLQFPVIHATDAFVCCQVTIYEDIMELWRRLWEKFILFARATPTVEPNIEMEEVASTLLALCQSKGTEEPDVSAPMYFLIVEVLALLTETFAYSKLGKGPAELPSSPAKPKRKPHPLHNLGACVELTALVFERVCTMVTRQRNHMADKICQASINMMEGILKAPMKYVKQFLVHIVKIMSRCLRVNPAVVFDFHVEQRFVDMLKCFSGLIEAYVTQEGVTESSLEHLSSLESLFTVAFTSTNDKVKLEVHKLLNVCVSSIPVAGLEVPSLLLEVQRKWDQASVTHESIEDFIEATPKGRSSRRSIKLLEKPRRGPSRNSTPKSNPSSATKKTDRNKDGNGSAAAATPGQLSVKLMKSRNRRLSSSSSVDGSASPVPSDASVFLSCEDISEGVGTSTAVDGIPVERVRKTRKGANSQQNKEEKHTAESQEEEDNIKTVVPKDSDKANHADDGATIQTETASTTFRKSSRKRSVKSNLNNSINLSKGEGNKSQDSITVFAPRSTTKDKNDKDGETQAQNCSKENVGKTDEENMLHDDVFRRKTSKDDLSSPDQGISVEQLKPNILKALNKTPQAESSIRSKRINFMKVSVSPSVVKDVKIVEKQPKVEISFSTDPDITVSESDSENEIPSSLEVNSSISRNLTCLSENNTSGKVQLKEKLPVECQDEPMECSKSGGISTSGKRKRKLFDEGEHSSGSRRKKTARMSSQDESDSASLDASVMTDLPDLSFDFSTSTTENKADDAQPITPKKTRKSTASETKVSSRKVEDLANMNEESPAKRAKGGPTRDHKRGSAKESNESFTKDNMSTEMEEKSKTMSAFSPKVTRSGRKIVPPNKDMPQPMTPPKTSKRRLHQRGASETEKDPNEGSSTDFFDLNNSAPNCDDNSKSVLSVTTDSEIENEKEVDNEATERGHKDSWEHLEDRTSEIKDYSDDCIILDDDDVPSVKEGKRHEAKSSDIRTYMRRRSSAPKPSESQKHDSSKAPAQCVGGKESSGTITLSSGDSVQEQSAKSSDSRESENQSLNIAALKSALQEKKQSSDEPAGEGSLDDTESNSSKADKSKSEKAVAEKDERQPHRDVEKEGGVNQSEDSLEQQKTTDESTPMECAQTLVEEVTYPISSRGTEALDDSGGNETLHKGREIVSEDKDEEEEESEDSDEEDGKETEAKDVAGGPPESPAESESDEEEEEEGDESPCEDNEEVDRPDSPLAQDLEVEEEECISAGQEVEKEEENMNTEATVGNTNGKQQETTGQETQEPEEEEDKDKTDQESESSDEDSTSDEKKSEQEVESGKITSPPPEEETSVVSKPSEVEETDAPTCEKQGDSVKDGNDQEEMEVESESAVSEDAQEVEDANSRPSTEEKDNSETEHKDKDDEEPQTTSDGPQNKLEKEKALVSGSDKVQKEKALVSGLEDKLEKEKALVCGLEDKLEKEKALVGVSQDKVQKEKALVSGSQDKVQKEKALVSGPEDKLEKEKTLDSGSQDKVQKEKALVSGSQDKLEKEKALVSGSQDKLEKEKALVSGSQDKLEKEKALDSGSQDKLEKEKALVSGSQDKLEKEKALVSGSQDKVQKEKALVSGSQDKLEKEKALVSGSQDKVQKEKALDSGSQDKVQKEKTLDSGSQDKVQKEKALVSENVESNEEVEEASSVVEDVDEGDKSLPKDVPELSVGDSGLGEGSKVESQIVPEKELSGSENNDMEVEISEQESTDSLRRETETNKSSSDGALVQAEEAAPSHKENGVSVEAGVSSERTDTADGTATSPRKAAKSKVDPRRTVQVKETGKLMRVSSPNQTIQAMTATPLSRGKEPTESSVVGTEKAEEPGEGESDPKVVQVTERTSTEAASASEATTGSSSTTPMPSEASEEPAPSVRQQEEELSPDKSSRSRLKLTVSTPERLKRGALMHAGSRAALLVACAKQNIKNRGGGETESTSGVLTESGRSRSLGSSPTRRSAPSRPSPGHSPDSRRRSHLDTPGMRPWMKHSPSPGASPSTSILKRTLLTDGTDGDTPSPPHKYRRVSFADPPVSERVEIPPSPRTLKGIRAQKRLDMTRMASPTKDSDAQPVENQEPSPDKDPEVLDYENPIFPALRTCPDKVEQVAQYLTSPATLPGLLFVLEREEVFTVGQLAKMTELSISFLPVKAPKVVNMRRALRDYEKTQPRHPPDLCESRNTRETDPDSEMGEQMFPMSGIEPSTSQADLSDFSTSWPKRERSRASTPVKDDVEQTLAKMFGELDRDDKENRRPNQQDCVADPVVMTEVEVRESSGRASHSDNIQEIMEMEDITPLDATVDDTEAGALKSLYRRASEQDRDAQKRLLHHLLLVLPPRDVAEAIAESIKARMDVPAAASSSSSSSSTNTTTASSTSST
ncbi:telomere-associated protein RIF1-like isoform X9 [Eriocheir sinensis]|uniref:telomere-associated protein RIF1-like isoform X9 n=1 Tax=Eriocheir sinensis TaxID=95602 RepID=UPI0021C5983E|nr:telomere-associated protein RIF1-like isoform X9 [Eriocheir sinensis]